MQTLDGTVISNKTPQTVTVAINYVFRHPRYKKILKRTTKIVAHNQIANIQVGSKVRLVKSRPYSKTKHFRVLEVLSATAKS